MKKTAKVGGERRGREGRGKEGKEVLVNCKGVVGTHGEGRRAGFASELRNTAHEVKEGENAGPLGGRGREFRERPATHDIGFARIVEN